MPRPGRAALVLLDHRHSRKYYLTIMGVRRALAGLLLGPVVARPIARLAGERARSNNTDGPGNPLSKAYSRSEVARLFAWYRSVTTAVRYLNLRLYPGGRRLARTPLAAALERRIGWHLYVEAVK